MLRPPAVLIILHLLAACGTAERCNGGSAGQCADRRPPAAERSFVSRAVDAYITKLSQNMTADPQLACLFRNTLPNTLDTTVRPGAHQSFTFVITGDIDAMWLRDSTNQVLPYLPFAASDAPLRNMLTGLLRQQAAFVLMEPYANAFYLTSDPMVKSPNTGDDTTSPSSLCLASHGNCSYAGTRVNGMRPGVYERKYELDSLMAFLKLGRMLLESVSVSQLDASPYDAVWYKAVGRVLDVLEAQQQSSAEDASGPCGPSYTFSRSNLAGQGPHDTLLHGVGPPAARTGMIRSAFRPSDDSCTFPFLVPANAMAVVELQHTAALLRALNASLGEGVAARCERIATDISNGITRYGIIDRPDLGGRVYAYEVDGFGNANFMDDANIPSLLSLPWLGYVASTDPTYLRTRSYVLSTASNPWFFSGPAGEGVGSPHTGANTVWPMAITMRALTSSSDAEITQCLAALKQSASAPGSWLMHESFRADNAASFTRPWFAWANSLFGGLIIKLSRERPRLLLGAHHTV